MRAPQIITFCCLLFIGITSSKANMNFAEDSLNMDSLRVPSYIEGPHARWLSENRIEVFYIKHDSLKNRTRKISRTYGFRRGISQFTGFAGNDKNSYRIPRTLSPDSDEYPSAEKIVVLGDIHGEYSSLLKLLRHNGIIDDQHNWKWGKGHLVFTGDVMDRGDKVTECLWLIFNLELQAKKAGGHVHYLLGNHEVMALLFDNRYVNNKYLHACHFLDTQYSHLFNKNTILGNWLRSKNAMVKVGPYLFVHGGLSPRIIEHKLPINTINRGMRHHINNYLELTDTTKTDLFLHSQSPIWYRGYLSRTPYYPQITFSTIKETLEFYDASTIIFGHTPVSRVYPMYNYKLIAMDVPIGDPNFEDQGLLIYNQKFFRIFTHRNKEPL